MSSKFSRWRDGVSVESAMLGVFIVSVLMALFTQAPILLHGSPLSTDRIWPIHPDDTEPARVGALVVQSTSDFGCLEVRSASARRGTVICHRILGCRGTPSPESGTSYDIFKAARGYKIEVCSRCDSECCDCRSTLISPEGVRLDDSLFQRVWNRMYLGSPLLVIAVLCVYRSRRGRRGLLTSAGLILGLGIPSALLWVYR